VLKLADNPPVLTPGVDALSELEGRWWVAHTKARNEKALAWDLLRHGIGYFLPMRCRVFFSGGRKRRGMAPLFTSYVFFCGDLEDRYTAMTTKLTAIESALAGDAELEPYPGPAIGRRCRIVGGPFDGLEGVVVERARRARLVLQVGLLGQGAAMEIEADLLEPID